MRTALFVTVLLIALPALAADPQPAAPPSPAPVTYEVWGFKWDGSQYVKQATHCLKTTDMTAAANYAAQINAVAGWVATTNLPASVAQAPLPVIDTAVPPPTIAVGPAYAAKARELIDSAIDRGVPLFNDGHPEGCKEVYERTARALLSMPPGVLSGEARETLRRAVDGHREEGSASDQAWALRHALDEAAASLPAN